MKRLSLRWLPFLLLALILPAGPAGAQEGGRYYPETGHTLDAVFVEYYDTHGGLAILGYPITEAFVDSRTGMLVQYTQNARLERFFDAESGGFRVRLALLGEELGGWEPPLPALQFPVGEAAGCRYYEVSGHRVCHAFLAFYEAHGGPAQFGFPISEFRLERGRIVQYFQGFRFDWYPEAPPGERVRLAPLGRLHFEAMGYDPALLEPRTPSNILDYRVTELNLASSVALPVTTGSGEQEIYLVVRDQNLQPVAGAAVTLVARFADGERTLAMPLTDAHGVSRVRLSFDGQPPGTNVLLRFTVIHGGLQAETRDSFRIWW